MSGKLFAVSNSKLHCPRCDIKASGTRGINVAWIEVDRIAAISAGATVFYRWSTAVCLWMMSEANQEDSITYRRASIAASKVT